MEGATTGLKGSRVIVNSRGESSPKASLTTLEVHLIRWMFYEGFASPTLLSRIFNVSTVQINMIVSGRSWKHISSHIDMSLAKKRELDRFYAKHARKDRPGRRVEDQKVIREMRLRSELGWSQSRIAEFYHLSPSHVSRVVRGKTWSQVS
jgi:Helix-turn-helix